jgi:hypothetical protein
MTLLFFSNTWRGIDEKDLPVKPELSGYYSKTGGYYASALKKYEKALSVAKATKSLEVENPKKCSFVD